MSVFTAISSQIHEWAPLRAVVRAPDDMLGFVAQHLWMQLYTMPEAKNGVPGLMICSVNTIAEATGKGADLVRSLLDRLIEHELVEFDQGRRVLRLAILPDALEAPPNANVLRGWWRRFKNIPECPIKAAHVATLRWLLDERCRVNAKPMHETIAQAWADTFGTIAIPVPRRRGVRRLQMNLFPESSEAGDRSGNGSAAVDEPAFVGSATSDPKPKEIRGPETVSKPFRNGRVPDQEQVSVSGSGSGSGGGVGEGHEPGIASSSRPHLAIVPESTPYGPAQVLKTLERDSGGRFVATADDSLLPALRDVVAHLCEHGVTLDGLALLSAWMGRGLAVEGAEGKRFLGAWWAAKPNVLLFAYQRAVIAERDAERERVDAEKRSAELRAVLSEGPYNLHL